MVKEKKLTKKEKLVIDQGLDLISLIKKTWLKRGFDSGFRRGYRKGMIRGAIIGIVMSFIGVLICLL
jgi:hypothetical protein